MFDWSNRVIGFLDPDYASSAAFDTSRGSDLAREALAVRPAPDADGRMPDPRSRLGMPDLYRYAHLLGAAKRADPGADVMSILLAQLDDEDGRLSVEEFENMFWLFAVAGNETLRNGLPGAMVALLDHPDVQRALRADPATAAHGRGRTAALVDAGDDLPPDGHPRHRARPGAGREGDKVVVSFVAANRDPAVFARPDVLDIRRAAEPAPGLRARPALLPRRAPGPRADAHPVHRTADPHQLDRACRRARLPAVELPARRQAAADPLDGVSLATADQAHRKLAQPVEIDRLPARLLILEVARGEDRLRARASVRRRTSAPAPGRRTRNGRSATRPGTCVPHQRLRCVDRSKTRVHRPYRCGAW